MAFSLQIGKVRVGPVMLTAGILLHILFPAAFVFLAWRLDRWIDRSMGLSMWTGLPAGAVVLGLSIVLEVKALPHFFRAGGSPSPLQPTESLIVAGPYRYCRHPIYLAYAGYVLGVGLMLDLFSAPLFAALVLAAMSLWAKTFEEPDLVRRFGEEYIRYRQSTPFLFPRSPQ